MLGGSSLSSPLLRSLNSWSESPQNYACDESGVYCEYIGQRLWPEKVVEEQRGNREGWGGGLQLRRSTIERTFFAPENPGQSKSSYICLRIGICGSHVCLCLILVSLCFICFSLWNEGKRKPNSQTLEDLKDLWNSPSSTESPNTIWDFLAECFLENQFSSDLICICQGLTRFRRKLSPWWHSFWAVGFWPIWWIDCQSELWCDLCCDHRRSLTDTW